jgi:hypothetical protein
MMSEPMSLRNEAMANVRTVFLVSRSVFSMRDHYSEAGPRLTGFRCGGYDTRDSTKEVPI